MGEVELHDLALQIVLHVVKRKWNIYQLNMFFKAALKEDADLSIT